MNDGRQLVGQMLAFDKVRYRLLQALTFASTNQLTAHEPRPRRLRRVPQSQAPSQVRRSRPRRIRREAPARSRHRPRRKCSLSQPRRPTTSRPSIASRPKCPRRRPTILPSSWTRTRKASRQRHRNRTPGSSSRCWRTRLPSRCRFPRWSARRLPGSRRPSRLPSRRSTSRLSATGWVSTWWTRLPAGRTWLLSERGGMKMTSEQKYHKQFQRKRRALGKTVTLDMSDWVPPAY